jgi:beta-galactosidase
VEAIYKENGIDCLLFTSDGSEHWMLSGGTLPHMLKVVNFGSHPTENFDKLKAFGHDGPLMCGEFWCGWFDHWYEEHHTRTPEDVAADTRELLESGASINYYMLHGGTNFGFTNGANYHQGYEPTVTSYDYCSPISECGDLTPTFYAVKQVLEDVTGEKAPEMDVTNLPKAAYGNITLTQSAALFENLPQSIPSAIPQTMEDLDQDFGYLVYSTTLRGPFEPLKLEYGKVHDRAIIFLNGKRMGLWERSRVHDEITLSLAAGETARLDILLENMGRVNYGPKLFDRKGILDGIRLGQRFHFGWDQYCLPMEDLSGLQWQPATAWNGQPTFLKGELQIIEAPADTFLRLDGFTKGFVTVNGFNIGRYFNSAGPQRTLYVPAPLLKEGSNEIIVFETDGFEKPVITFQDAPDLG